MRVEGVELVVEQSLVLCLCVQTVERYRAAVVRYNYLADRLARPPNTLYGVVGITKPRGGAFGGLNLKLFHQLLPCRLVFCHYQHYVDTHAIR